MDLRFRHPIARVVLRVLPVFLFAMSSYGQSAKTSSDDTAGQRTFSTCAGCHGLDGRGGEHAPNIATDPAVQGMPDTALLAIIKNGIPASGMPGFAKLLSDAQLQAVLKYLRLLQGSAHSANVLGNERRGRDLFFGQAGCAECHMIGGRGGSFGADLSGYGKNHSGASIREEIVSPEKNVDARHGTVTAVTRAGKTYRGVVRNEDNFSLQMQTVDGSFHLLDKADLVRTEHESRSLMPSDYGSRLTTSELNDLIRFLSQVEGSAAKPENDEEDQ